MYVHIYVYIFKEVLGFLIYLLTAKDPICDPSVSVLCRSNQYFKTTEVSRPFS